MLLIFCSLTLFLCGAFFALLCGRGATACRVGAAFGLAGAVSGFAGVIWSFWQNNPAYYFHSWGLPFGDFALHLDPLAALFLLPVCIIAGLTSLHGAESTLVFAHKKHMGAHWFFFNLLILGMFLVFLAADGFFFLVSWEIMSLATFFLLLIHADNASSRKGIWMYLVAAHLGVLCILPCIGQLAFLTGSFSFTDWYAIGSSLPSPFLTGIFIFALLGFGAKSVLMPFHVWLPETYPIAPAHVAGLISGTLINAGIYGMLRMLTFIGIGAEWWGLLLLGLGAFSAIIGIIFAFIRRDMQRILAYSSIKNMGLLWMSLGTALTCVHNELWVPAVLSYAALLLHMFNHCFGKCLYFLSANAVQAQTGTSVLSQLGGLQKRMPYTGLYTFVANCSLIGLPPFGGFTGKFLLYVALALAAIASTGGIALVFWGSLVALAAISGLALLCYARLHGICFLGNPRSLKAEKATEISGWPLHSMGILAGMCLLLGLLPAFMMLLITPALNPLPGILEASTFLHANIGSSYISDSISNILVPVAYVNAILIIILVFVTLLREQMLRKKISKGPTWDCGYALPSARMQYTGGSFAQTEISILLPLVRGRINLPTFTHYFPRRADASISVPDWMADSWFGTLFQGVSWLAQYSKRLQNGHLNLYILYILLALLITLIWKL